MRSYWIKVGFNPMTDVLINGWKFGQRHTDKRMPDWSDASANQGTRN